MEAESKISYCDVGSVRVFGKASDRGRANRIAESRNPVFTNILFDNALN